MIVGLGSSLQNPNMSLLQQLLATATQQGAANQQGQGQGNPGLYKLKSGGKSGETLFWSIYHIKLLFGNGNS